MPEGEEYLSAVSYLYDKGIWPFLNPSKVENRDQDLLSIQEHLLFHIALPYFSAISGSIAEAVKVKIAHVERYALYCKLYEKLPKAPMKYQIFHLHKFIAGRCYFIIPMHE